MKVYLKNTWFVAGRRFRRSQSKTDLVEVPDFLAPRLPSSAKIVDEEFVAAQVKEEQTRSALARAPGRSMVDFLKSNPQEAEPEEDPEPEDEDPEPEDEDPVAKAKQTLARTAPARRGKK